MNIECADSLWQGGNFVGGADEGRQAYIMVAVHAVTGSGGLQESKQVHAGVRHSASASATLIIIYTGVVVAVVARDIALLLLCAV